MVNCENKAVMTKVVAIKNTYPMTYILLLLVAGPYMSTVLYIKYVRDKRTNNSISRKPISMILF